MKDLLENPTLENLTSTKLSCNVTLLEHKYPLREIVSLIMCKQKGPSWLKMVPIINLNDILEG